MAKTTLDMARAEWSERWERLRAYAGKTARTFCSWRLIQYGQDRIDEIRDEAMSEAWRYVCNGEKAEKAIVKAINNLTYLHQKHWREGQRLGGSMRRRKSPKPRSYFREMLRSIPEKFRPLAVILSSGLESNREIAAYLGCSERTVRNHRQQLQSLLARYRVEPKPDFLTWLTHTFAPSRRV